MEYACRSRCAFRRAGTPQRFALALLSAAAVHATMTAAAIDPARAFWVASSAMSSPIAVQRAVSSALSGGFNTVVAEVPVGASGSGDPFDGAAEILRRARENGLAVQLSVSVTSAAGVGELPPLRGHVLYQHPEWLMVPRELAPELLKLDARNPAYLGRISRWTRAHADRVGGLYVSPLDPAAAAYLVDAVMTVVRRYAVDAVYLDAIDFPGRDFDYSRRSLEVFRGVMRARLPLGERTRLDEIEPLDPFAYPEEFPEEWSQFREVALTRLLEQLSDALKASNPSLTVAAGVRSDAEASLREHFQNWRAWLDRGIVSRVGYRDGQGGPVLLSTDGVIPPAPPRVSRAQPAGSSDVR